MLPDDGLDAPAAALVALSEACPHFGQNLTPASISEPHELQNAIDDLS